MGKDRAVLATVGDMARRRSTEANNREGDRDIGNLSHPLHPLLVRAGELEDSPRKAAIYHTDHTSGMGDRGHRHGAVNGNKLAAGLDHSSSIDGDRSPVRPVPGKNPEEVISPQYPLLRSSLA